MKNYTNKNILVVGGAGYIGGYLTDILINDGHKVTVYDNLLYETRYLKDINFVYGDILDREKLLPILDKFDVVIWLAAIVGDGACAIDPAMTKAVNEDCVKWVVDNYNGRIVFASTCSVYGIQNNLIDELAGFNPQSIYASTKLAAEKYIVENHNDYLIFRLGTLFGLGDYFSRIRLDLVVNILTARAVKGETLTVFGGEQWRPLLHVKDVGNAVSFCLKNGVVGLFNLSYKNFRINQIAEEIALLINEVKIEYADMEFEDLRNYKVKTDKIRSTGWTPTFTIKDGINEIKSLIKENRIINSDDPVYHNAAFMEENYGT
ncbi:MAG: NAD-dependent dehydratase [Candidatus Marinimicrobia bacterium]|nr:NAD-dependent dehydratase [Candidatus Neomarinimicrobiota bacterium]|tara:strand:+ start:29423 stop:30379 length:957 start_codon:yes stop_codon:yes gene_type:complete